MRTLRLIHAWTGTIMCLMLAILGLSGTLLVFKSDYVRASIPQARTLVATDPVALAKAVSVIEARSVRSKPKYITFGDEELGVHLVGYHDNSSAYADSNGTILTTWAKNGRVEDWVFDLHHHLLAGETGEIASGIAGLVGAVLTLSGLIIWLPSIRSFTFRIVPSTLSRRELVSTHRNLGAMVAIPILILTLTGSALVFSDQAKWLLARTLSSQEVPKAPKVRPGQIDWPQALIAAQNAYPDAKLRLVIWPKKPTDPMTIRLKQPGEWHNNGRTIVWIDPRTSQIAGTIDALKLRPAQSVFNALYPLHAAKLGNGFSGRVVDITTAFIGLALTALGLTGAYSFLRSLKAGRAIKPRLRS